MSLGFASIWPRNLSRALALSVSAVSAPTAEGELQITRDSKFCRLCQDRLAMAFTGDDATWLGETIQKALTDLNVSRALWAAGALEPYVAESRLKLSGQRLRLPSSEAESVEEACESDFWIQMTQAMTTGGILKVIASGHSGDVESVLVEVPARVACESESIVYAGLAEQDALMVPTMIREATRTLGVLARAKRAGTLSELHRVSWPNVEVRMRLTRP